MVRQEAVDPPADAAVQAHQPISAKGSPEMETASNYCPRCSARLAARSCKLICPSCGYYMSCSDFY